MERAEYPDALRSAEWKLIWKRRGQRNQGEPPDQVGFGLSGGGIRSATFALGLFQGLAKQELPEKGLGRSLLSKIDYLSTVSGGGYFGAFFGRLFTRKEVAEFTDVEDILLSRAAKSEHRGSLPEGQKFPAGAVFRWLRENGRYLAPNGGGDLLLGIAAVLRNWFAVQIVLLTFILMIFLLAQIVRRTCEAAEPARWNAYQAWLGGHLPWSDHGIWWSPYILLPALAFLFLVVPPAWAYWLVEKPENDQVWYRQFRSQGNWLPPAFGLIAAIAAALWGILGGSYGSGLFDVSLIVLVCSIVTTVWWTCVVQIHKWKLRRSGLLAQPSRLISFNEQLRFRLSAQLKGTLLVFSALLIFTVIDSLGQTAYGLAILHRLHLKSWVVAVVAPLAAIAGFARTILTALDGKPGGRRFSIPVSLLAGIGAAIVAILLLIAVDTFSYAVAWNFCMPVGPHPSWTTTHGLVRDASQLMVRASGSRFTVTPSEPGDDGEIKEPEPVGVTLGSPTFQDWRLPLAAWLVTVVFSFLFGWSWPFLNRSTQHAVYTSRLIRAYLGASNPERLRPTGPPVSRAAGTDESTAEQQPQDDIAQDDYWPRHRWLKPGTVSNETPEAGEDRIFGKGAPLHLVNVTINETIDGRSQVEQRDRKGIGMAIGPAALSAGVAHHLVMPSNAESTLHVFPDNSASGSFRVFGDDRFNGELLSLGNWTGISGAAFSTGLGWRTSLGFSLLAGLANVRLSYWWNSGVQRKNGSANQGKTKRGNWLLRFLHWSFSVQTFFFYELLARFPGTALQWWPLSDGGHFENMGGYELVRRHLPLIVIVDVEADPHYSFEGLSNLVRKARLDFDAEIRFLTEEQLDERIHSKIRVSFGTLEQLRRGTWIEEPVEDPTATPPDAATPRRKRLTIDPENEEALSLAHAALADIYYDSSRPEGLLLYIKPTLIGDEPADVRRYHNEHPDFPHESTADQFFDETQWESYRRLGEHIADKIFGRQPTATTDERRFLPYNLKSTFPYQVGR